MVLHLLFKRLLNHNKVINLLIPSVAASILFSYVLNLGIMKPLLKFQSQSNAAAFIKENNYESLDLYLYNENEKAKSRSFNFYLDKNIKFIDSNTCKMNLTKATTGFHK